MTEKTNGKRIFRDIFKLHPFRASLGYAFSGIAYLFLYHRNMRVIFLAGIAAFLLGVSVGLTRAEYAVLFITVCFVFLAEMFNTAIELIIDMFTDKYHVLVKIIKDISAGVVLIACLNALVIGYFLFWNKIVLLLR